MSARQGPRQGGPTVTPISVAVQGERAEAGDRGPAVDLGDHHAPALMHDLGLGPTLVALQGDRVLVAVCRGGCCGGFGPHDCCGRQHA